MKVEIVNIVATTKIGREVDLNRAIEIFSKLGWEIEYEPEMFTGLVVKNQKAACVIFRSGHINCTGAKSEKDAKKITEDVVKILEEKLCLKEK